MVKNKYAHIAVAAELHAQIKAEAAKEHLSMWQLMEKVWEVYTLTHVSDELLISALEKQEGDTGF